MWEVSGLEVGGGDVERYLTGAGVVGLLAYVVIVEAFKFARGRAATAPANGNPCAAHGERLAAVEAEVRNFREWLTRVEGKLDEAIQTRKSR